MKATVLHKAADNGNLDMLQLLQLLHVTCAISSCFVQNRGFLQTLCTLDLSSTKLLLSASLGLPFAAGFCRLSLA